MCHSIVKVKGTMGQGDFTLEYPALHALAASNNPYDPATARFHGEAESGTAPARFSKAVHA